MSNERGRFAKQYAVVQAHRVIRLVAQTIGATTATTLLAGGAVEDTAGGEEADARPRTGLPCDSGHRGPPAHRQPACLLGRHRQHVGVLPYSRGPPHDPSPPLLWVVRGRRRVGHGAAPRRPRPRMGGHPLPNWGPDPRRRQPPYGGVAVVAGIPNPMPSVAHASAGRPHGHPPATAGHIRKGGTDTTRGRFLPFLLLQLQNLHHDPIMGLLLQNSTHQRGPGTNTGRPPRRPTTPTHYRTSRGVTMTPQNPQTRRGTTTIAAKDGNPNNPHRGTATWDTHEEPPMCIGRNWSLDRMPNCD